MDGELWRIWQVLLVIAAVSTLSPSVPGVDAWSDPLEHLHTPNFDDSKYVPGEPMTPTDFQNAEGLVADSPPQADGKGKNKDPIELAGLYEGDIILKHNRKMERNGILSEKQKWSGGQVPYVISSDFSAHQRGVIAKAMTEYHTRTCITFKPRTTETDYIHIHRGSGCSSFVGKAGGAQPVSIGPGCEYSGIIVHELMHAVGFWHEQSRFDRDDYITIYYDNIQSGMEFNFRKYSWTEIQNLSAPYDLTSVMHYGAYAFSKYKGRPTILPKDPNQSIGQRNGFSDVDVMKINRLYRCSVGGQKPSTIAPPITTQTSLSCNDNHRHCSYWAKQNECSRNAAWMKANCKRSCNQCNKPCQDLNQYCPSWAKRGECGRNPDYMNVYCQKACNTCPSDSINNPTQVTTPKPNPSCDDKDKNCSYWASKGECSRNPHYMNRACPKSCKVC